MNPKEAKAENIRHMGDELGAQFSALWQEVANLHSKWSEFVELFGSKPARIDLLNQAAPAFFGMIQIVLWENILLGIARISDPPTSPRNRKNLTLLNLPALVNDEATRQEVVLIVDQIMDETKFCRDWRNRHIAHNDLDLVLERSASPLLDASRKQVSDALKNLSRVMNVVQGQYSDAETGYDLISTLGGAEHFLYILDDGLRRQKDRQERLFRGEWSQAEDGPRDL